MFAKMQNVRVLLIACHAHRHFCTGNIRLKSTAAQEARVLSKLIRKGSKSNWDITSALTANQGSFDLQKKECSPHVLRRVNVLNKIYMDYVVQIMSNCAIYQETIGVDIEISHVNITNDFKTLNIFWFDNLQNQEESTILEEKLQVYARELRHRLATLRIIGKVPIVQFVKNRHVDIMMDIEQRLAKADFGEDYEPNPASHNTEPRVTYEYSGSAKNAEDTKTDSNNEKESFSVTLPKMRHDIFGVDHAKIMQRIQASVNKKADAEERRLKAQRTYANKSNTNMENTAPLMTYREQQIMFHKYLRTREKCERERRKRMKKTKQLTDFTDDKFYYNDEDAEEYNSFDSLDYEESEEDT